MIVAMNITSTPAVGSVPADPFASALAASRFLIAKKAIEIQATTGVAIVQQLLDPGAGRNVDFRA
ncbi:MAG: hypothetical protein DYG91_04465 [Chloroflexi bacterium CFX7]|nr:hypothetical protein [Chloroflexi bacterium CFX7]MCK6564712.1 hypothetical protein [Dehalococcoidia bacterium]RIL04326.1 MAG: hypothetical protein DCC78_01765 [bacterium]